MADEVKKDAAETVAGLKRLGVKKIAMLTGDDETPAGRAAAALGIDTCITSSSPRIR
ncbi:MAG: HAD family hydrolase [Bacillota bacterium]